MSLLTLNFLVFVLTAAACFTFYRAVWQPKASIAKRLIGEAETERRLSGGFSAIVQQAINKWPARPPVANSPAEQKLSSALTYAGFRSAQAVAAFQLFRGTLMIGFALVGAALGASLGKPVLGIAAAGCTLGYVLPTLVIRRLATARQRRIRIELPDILALLVVSLEAGVGFSEAVKLVGREAERQRRIMGQELAATAAQMAAGRSMEDSLKNLAERTGVDEIKSMTALAIQSEKVGARIAPALRASAEQLSSQRRLAAEETAHKAAIKMLFPLIFLILPAMMLIVLGPALIQVFRTFSSK
jgi:tight adherence protein C